MQRSDDALRIVATAGLLLETSLGSLTVDIVGADCPALSGNFLNLCRAEFWNGAVATEVIPEVAVFFSLTADPVYSALLRSKLEQVRIPACANAIRNTPERGVVQSFWALLPRQDTETTVAEGEGDPTSASTTRHTLRGAGPRPTLPALNDPVEQQEKAFQQAVQQEVRLCKRRRCVGLSLQPPSNPRNGNEGVYRPVFQAASKSGSAAAGASPCSVCRAGCLLIDVTAPALRFGLTLSNRTADFLDTQYVVVGHVREGEGVLKRMQRAAYRDRAPATLSHSATNTAAALMATAQEDVVAGRPAAAWPHLVRLLRIKRAIVLPTAGTEKFFSASPSSWLGLSALGGVDSAAEAQLRQQRIGQALQQAGCFAWWASATAVRAAHRQLVQVVQASLQQEKYTAPARPNTIAEATALLQGSSSITTALDPSSAFLQKPFIILQDRDTGTSSGGSGNSLATSRAGKHAHEPADMLQLTYNPHYTGDYLSSEDDDDDVYSGGAGHDGAANASQQALHLSAKQLEERRKLFMQRHQEKANETLSLMLNVLNGVADTRGDIKPPENVLFVCKLNPVTTGDGLATCFAQFGRVVSAEVIYDAKTKQSLCYGFVEFETVEACFRAFQKMDRALIDDCRIHVDFSQSVSKLWAQRQREMRKRDRPS